MSLKGLSIDSIVSNLEDPTSVDVGLPKALWKKILNQWKYSQSVNNYIEIATDRLHKAVNDKYIGVGDHAHASVTKSMQDDPAVLAALRDNNMERFQYLYSSYMAPHANAYVSAVDGGILDRQKGSVAYPTVENFMEEIGGEEDDYASLSQCVSHLNYVLWNEGKRNVIEY